MDIGLRKRGRVAKVDVDDNNGVENNEPDVLNVEGKLGTDLVLCRVGELDKIFVYRG